MSLVGHKSETEQGRKKVRTGRIRESVFPMDQTQRRLKRLRDAHTKNPAAYHKQKTKEYMGHAKHRRSMAPEDVTIATAKDWKAGVEA